MEGSLRLSGVCVREVAGGGGGRSVFRGKRVGGGAHMAVTVHFKDKVFVDQHAAMAYGCAERNVAANLRGKKVKEFLVPMEPISPNVGLVYSTLV
ncbi:hypothetical protein ABZP36_035367 [Zizania latifolia]